ncbi:hypothetical protein E4U30_000372, partial [Claviceps sp. LM220 group G6]
MPDPTQARAPTLKSRDRRNDIAGVTKRNISGPRTSPGTISQESDTSTFPRSL